MSGMEIEWINLQAAPVTFGDLEPGEWFVVARIYDESPGNAALLVATGDGRAFSLDALEAAQVGASERVYRVNVKIAAEVQR